MGSRRQHAMVSHVLPSISSNIDNNNDAKLTGSYGREDTEREMCPWAISKYFGDLVSNTSA
jgi:hypothetical protein